MWTIANPTLCTVCAHNVLCNNIIMRFLLFCMATTFVWFVWNAHCDSGMVTSMTFILLPVWCRYNLFFRTLRLQCTSFITRSLHSNVLKQRCQLISGAGVYNKYLCPLQVGRIWAANWMASRTKRASFFSPPATTTVSVEVAGSAVCQLALW